MGQGTERLQNGTQVYTSAQHRFGTDAILLAAFCPPRRAEQAVDLCSGCGIVALQWHDAGHRGPCWAVELSGEASGLLAAALASQPEAAAHITPIQGDVRGFWHGQPASCHLVACNPPYFAAGPHSPQPARAQARHELAGSFEDMAACAARCLRDGGRFAFCWPPARLAEAFAALRANRLEPKRLAFVKKQPGAAPWLFLCEAQKNRRPGLAVLPDLITGAVGAAFGPAAPEQE